MKKCSNCGCELTPETRYPKVNNKLCIPCYLAYMRGRYLLTREKYKASKKLYYSSPRGKERLNLATQKAREKYPEKWEARAKLRKAIIKGEIIKPEICEYRVMSDLVCRGRIEAHHHLGYDREHWKDVKWLCVRHHSKEHSLKNL